MLPVAVGATTPEQASLGRYLQTRTTPLAMMQKAKAGTPMNFEDNASTRRLAAPAPFFSNSAKDDLGYLDGPQGDTWFYTMTFDYDEVVYPGYTERLKKGFELSVYDSSYKLVGTVKDNIDLEDGDVKIAAISIDAMVSKKFFNFDDRYEVIINVAMNRPDYTVRYFANVYSVGAPADENGNTPVVQTLPGYVCASVNASTSSWDENFYLGIITESGYDDSAESLSEYAASNKQIITIYKKAGWGGGPQEIGKMEVAMPNLPGDQMSVPYFIADVRDGKPYFIFQHYEKWFFKNAIGPGTGMIPGETEEDGMPFDDNNLIIESFTYPGYGSTLIAEKTVKIPVDQTTTNPDVMFSYYSIGHLLYADDLTADGSATVCIQRYLRSDDDNYLTSFVKYDADGNKDRDIAIDVDGYVMMSDIRGFDSQVMFIEADGNGAYNLNFVNFPEAVEVMSIPSNFQNNQIRTNVDRFPVGDSYEYAFQTSQSHYDADRNILEHILWVTADGDYSHTDVLNLGKDIAMAQVYIQNQALSPYVFNTDEAREYMWLVKRYTSGASSSSESETWLYILSSDGTKLFEFGPDAEKGDLQTVALVNLSTNPALWIAYSNAAPGGNSYSDEFYSLPLTKFAMGGDGSKENPYKIATAGDFDQLRAYPDAYFELAADIVADGVEMLPVSDTFRGCLDGKGHKVTGLSLAGSGIFADLNAGAVVKDITFIGARILQTTGSAAGLVAANASGATISGVHVFGLEVAPTDNDLTFGGIVGIAALGTNISDCSLNSSTISLPSSMSVGGIAGNLRTGSKVNACSVKATIEAESELGGIVGNMYADGAISDCHADIKLSAQTVVGGIVGHTDGGTVSRCYVEGSVKATGKTGNVYFDNGPCAGGIAGSLKNAFSTSDSGESTTLTTSVILNNYVALESLEGYTPTVAPTFADQHKTIHRIVGRTQANETPEEIGYDDDYEPIYGDPHPADKRLANNYAVSDLTIGQDDIEALHSTTEGESVDAADLNADWFADKLGLEYGEGKYWNELAEHDPALQHEGGNFCSPAEISVPQGESFDIHVVFTGNEAMNIENVVDQFYYTSSDESVAEMTGDFAVSKTRLAVRFEALKQGTTTVDICGAKCTVTVTEPISGIDTIISGESKSALSFNGEYILGEGLAINIFNIAGTRVASGSDAVRVAALAPGVYIASANSGASLKFVVR